MNRARHAVLLASAVCLLMVDSTGSVYQSCSGCTPATIGSVAGLSGNYKVCIDRVDDTNGSNVMTQAEAEDFRDGVQAYWGNRFAATDVPISFDFEIVTGQCSAHDIKVYLDGSMGSGDWGLAAYTSDGRGAGIRVNPTYSNGYYSQSSSDAWNNFGAHEMGHILGWENVPQSQGCSGYTIMVFPPPTAIRRATLCVVTMLPCVKSTLRTLQVRKRNHSHHNTKKTAGIGI